MYSVLIVEDEILVSVGLRNMISWSEMNLSIVGEARNGKQGLELYHEKKPDIILTDIKMPIMDGLEMISEIRKKDTRTKIIILSSYEDFELVNQAYKLGISDYISKLQMMPEEIENVIQGVLLQLLESDKNSNGRNQWQIQDTSQQIVKKEIKDFILNPSGSYEKIKSLAESAQIREQALQICMMELVRSSVSCKESKDGRENREDNDKMVYAIENLLENILLEYKCGDVWAEGANRYLILLHAGNGQEEKNSVLKNILNRMRIAVRTCMNEECIFGISSVSDSYQELNMLYTEATDALNEALFLDEEVIVYGDAAIMEKYESLLKDCESSVLDMDFVSEECRKNVLQDIELLRERKVLNSEVIKETVIRWMHVMSFEKKMYREELMKITLATAENIRCTRSSEEMLRIFENYEKAINPDKHKKNLNRELSEAITYLKIHYCEEDISLPRVAQEVSLHKDYLSKLFKWELGIGFTDYVNSLRIKKAKELLKTTHMRVYEVSQAVGFSDESYFSKVFKKVTGVRPNEYKRNEMIIEDITDEE